MLNDLLKDTLQILVHNDVLMKAVREVFNERIEKNKPNILEISDNILLGEQYRAYYISKNIIEQAFIDLMSYKVNKIQVKFNKEK